MSEHLRMATEELYAAHQESLSLADSRILRVLDDLIHHLEAQQETPASEPSSAPTTGPAERRWEWRSVTPDVPTASLEETQGLFLLTVETTGYSKSMGFTPAELEAISWLFLTLPPTSELHTTSGSTKDGARGVAVPDSPKDRRQKDFDAAVAAVEFRAEERVRVLEEAAFLQRFQLRTAWFNLGCRCGFDDQHHKLFEDAHCPWHGTQVTKDSWEAVAGFSDDGTPLLPSSVATEGDHV